jgi:hypothetical protein
MLLKVALKSLLNRRITFCLTVLSIAISIFVLLGVEHVRKEARESFGRTVSGVDLIVGARTSQLNLLLYSVSASVTPPIISPGRAIKRCLLIKPWPGRFLFHWVTRIEVIA